MTYTSSELLTAETSGELPVLLTDTVISDTVLNKQEPKRTDDGSQFLTQFESGTNIGSGRFNKIAANTLILTFVFIHIKG